MLMERCREKGRREMRGGGALTSDVRKVSVSNGDAGDRVKWKCWSTSGGRTQIVGRESEGEEDFSYYITFYLINFDIIYIFTME